MLSLSKQEERAHPTLRLRSGRQTEFAAHPALPLRSGRQTEFAAHPALRLRSGRSQLEMIHWIISFAYGETLLTLRQAQGEE